METTKVLTLDDLAKGVVPTTGDLRALIAHRRILRYRLAAFIGMHPNALTAILNGRTALTQDVAIKIARVILEAE